MNPNLDPDADRDIREGGAQGESGEQPDTPPNPPERRTRNPEYPLQDWPDTSKNRDFAAPLT